MRYLTKILVCGLIFGFGCVSTTWADDPKSGPEVDATVTDFEVLLPAAEPKGQTGKALESYQDKPVLVVFISEMTRPGFRLLKTLDKYSQLRQPEGLRVVIVQISEDNEKALKFGKLLKERYGIAGDVVVSTDAKPGPAAYGLNDDAAMTILLLGADRKVLHNTARRAPDDQDFDTVRAGIDKLLGPSPVKFP